MILGPISYLDCIVFCVFLAPQLLLELGLIETIQIILQVLPFLGTFSDTMGCFFSKDGKEKGSYVDCTADKFPPLMTHNSLPTSQAIHPRALPPREKGPARLRPAGYPFRGRRGPVRTLRLCLYPAQDWARLFWKEHRPALDEMADALAWLYPVAYLLARI